MTLEYGWYRCDPDGPRQEITAKAATLDLSPYAGQYIGCIVSARDAKGAGSSLETKPVRAPVENKHTYQKGETIRITPTSELGAIGSSGFPILINEISRGYRSVSNPEWVELVTTAPADLRGYTLRTDSGKILVWNQNPESHRLKSTQPGSIPSVHCPSRSTPPTGQK